MLYARSSFPTIQQVSQDKGILKSYMIVLNRHGRKFGPSASILAHVQKKQKTKLNMYIFHGF